MKEALVPALEAVARYGYLGVHLFFMISGFVILMSAQGATPRSFVASRVSRLYPAFWTAATLTSAVTWAFNDNNFAVSFSNYWINLTMFAHWFKVPYIDGAYWSLAVEMHFYLYVLLAIRLGVFHRAEMLLAGWLVVSAINALRPMWPVEFWLNAKWAPLFIAGGLFFLIRTRGVSVPRLALLLGAFGLALIYAVREANWGDDGNYRGQLNSTVVVCAMTSFFAAFTAITLGWWKVKRSRFVALMGTLTYPLYLVHQNIGYVAYNEFLKLSGLYLPSLIGTITLVLGLSWLIYRGIEKTMAPKLKSLVGPPPASQYLSPR